MLDIFTIIISVFAITIAYLSLVSKKPRIYFKFTSVYNKNKNSHSINLNIVNCGDKPAFNIKIEPKNININMTENMNNSDDLDENDARPFVNANAYYYCINHVTKFVSGNSETSLYIGEISENAGDFNKKFKIDAIISFEEEFVIFKILNTALFAIDYLIKKGALLIFSYFCLFLLIKISSLNNHLGLILYMISFSPLNIYHVYLKNSKINNELEINGINYLLKNLGCKYENFSNKIKKEHEYEYEYEFKNMYVPIAVDEDNYCNNCKVLFDDPLYKIWEKSLTKDELNQFNKYRLEFMYDIKKYIEGIKKIDKYKKYGLYKKYLVLLDIILNLNFVDYRLEKKLKEILNEYK
jgi:hypothetical protein